MHALALRLERQNILPEDQRQQNVNENPIQLGGRRRGRGFGMPRDHRPFPVAVPFRQDQRANALIQDQRAPRARNVDRQVDNRNVDPVDRQEAALRRFIDMAGRDEEDQWDSDELDDDEAFNIRG